MLYYCNECGEGPLLFPGACAACGEEREEALTEAAERVIDAKREGD